MFSVLEPLILLFFFIFHCQTGPADISYKNKCVYVCVCVCVCLCVFVYMFVCVYVCMDDWCMNEHAFMHIFLCACLHTDQNTNFVSEHMSVSASECVCVCVRACA